MRDNVGSNPTGTALSEGNTVRRWVVIPVLAGSSPVAQEHRSQTPPRGCAWVMLGSDELCPGAVLVWQSDFQSGLREFDPRPGYSYPRFELNHSWIDAWACSSIG